MLDLGCSFSQRCKQSSKRPQDLHIHKVSFSGSSLASANSFVSTTSTSSTGTFGQRTDSAIAMDPLQLHPTHAVAPLPLSERRYISSSSSPASLSSSSSTRSFSQSPRWQEAVSYFDDDSSDDDESLYEDDDDETLTEEDLSDADIIIGEDKEQDLASEDSPEDYLWLQVSAKRPTMSRSRWSDSTVHSIDTAATEESIATPVQLVGIPNFSYKRVTVRARPPVKSADDITDDFIKRGRWKRRGIVFQHDEAKVAADQEKDYAFA